MYSDERRMYREQRRMYRRQNPLRGLAGGIFIIFLAFAFFFNDRLGSGLFLPLLFVGLAFLTLIGSLSTMNYRGIYGGLFGFVWFLGLALCFVIGFWPWILLPVGVSMILGTLTRPITAGLLGAPFLTGNQPPQPQQFYQPTYQPPQGPQQPPPGTYQESGSVHPYPPPEPPKEPGQAPPTTPLQS